MEKNKKITKIWLMGLDNAGKTSILLSLQKKTNLMSYLQLKPTLGVKNVNLKDIQTNLSIWDFGGQEQYRRKYLKGLDRYLVGTNKLIFVINIQDTERYDLALEYLNEVFKLLEKEEHQLELSIFLHKFDPDLQLDINSPILREHLPNLRKKLIEKIPKTTPYKIFKTSIFTVFQKIEDIE